VGLSDRNVQQFLAGATNAGAVAAHRQEMEEVLGSRLRGRRGSTLWFAAASWMVSVTAISKILWSAARIDASSSQSIRLRSKTIRSPM
jgi:hypothetical protein